MRAAPGGLQGVLAAVLLGSLLSAPVPVAAEGTEGLGPASIPIASGTGVAVGGTGLFDQPGTIEVTVPEDATVEQVLLYWEGQHLGSTGDDALVVAGSEVTGERIGGPRLFFGRVMSSTYRADVTDLGLVGPGRNAVEVRGADFGIASGLRRNDGAGLLVVYDEGGAPADIEVRDGNDLAFHKFDPPLDTTVPQTYRLAPADVERTATLALFASSVGADRPAAVEVTVDGVTERFCDVLGDSDGPQWDSVTLPVTIPAGADEVTVRVQSARCPGVTGKPASVAWSTAVLGVPPPPPEPAPAIDLTKTNDADRDGDFTDSETAPRPGAEVAFEVTVANAGATPLAVDRLTDAFGAVEVDLLAGAVTRGSSILGSNTCDRLDDAVLAAGETRTCRFLLEGYSPPSGESLVDTVGVVAHEPDVPGEALTASDTSTVTSPAGAVLAGEAGIVLDKTNDADGDGTFSDVETAPSAGADVAFRVVVRNAGAGVLVVDALTDAFGGVEVDLLAGTVPRGQATLTANSCDELARARLRPGTSRTCHFTLRGCGPEAGRSVVDTGEVVGHRQDEPDRSVRDRDDSTVRGPDQARLPRTGEPVAWLGVLAALLVAWGGGLLRRTRYRARH